MRNRKQITPEYLQNLAARIDTAAQPYKDYIKTLWLHKDEQSLAALEKIPGLLSEALAHSPAPDMVADEEISVKKLTLKEIAGTEQKDNPNHLQTYHTILTHVSECFKHSEHQDHEALQALQNLLVNELTSQKEAGWRTPDEDYPEQSCIHFALDNLREHAAYSSEKEKLYAERWVISTFMLNDLKQSLRASGKNLKWDEMCHDQWWHIQRNDRFEISLGARLILGLSDDNKLDCYVLHDKTADIREQENEVRILISQRDSDRENYKKKIAKLREQRKSNHGTASAITITDEINTLEQERSQLLADQNADIREKTKDIQNALIQLVLNSQDEHTHKNSIARLQDLYRELSLWTPRNLSILFIDNIIDAQIKKMKHLEGIIAVDKNEFETGDNNNELKKMIDSLSGEMLDILKAVNEVHDAIKNELSLLQKIVDDKLVSTHGLAPFTVNFMDIDAKEAAADFQQYAGDHLLEFTTLEHFKAVKSLRRYDSTSRHGIVLPTTRDVFEYQEPAPEALRVEVALTTAAPESDNGGLRKSKRVHSRLHQLGEKCESDDEQVDEQNDESAPLLPSPLPVAPVAAAHVIPPQPEPAWKSVAKNILIGMSIGLGCAILAVGIAAAIIFSGGFVLGAAVLAGIFGGIFGAGLLGGGVGGAIYSCRYPSTIDDTVPPAPPASIKTNNADMHGKLGIETVNTHTHSSGARDETGHLLPQVTVPTPLVVPTSQNPEMTAASVRNASRR